MTAGLTVTIAVYAAVLCAWAGVVGARGRPPSPSLVGGAVVLELGLLAQVLVRGAAWLAGARPSEPIVAAAYVLVGAFILPIAAGPPTRDSRPAALPLAVGCAAVVVMALRLRATWA